MPTVFPACMMPDGADPCEAFQKLQAEVERLRSALETMLRIVDSGDLDMPDSAQFVSWSDVTYGEIRRAEQALKVSDDADHDITSRLQWACTEEPGDSCLFCDACAEIERLRAALVEAKNCLWQANRTMDAIRAAEALGERQ